SSTFTVWVNSETTLGNYTYYPVINLAGVGGTIPLNSTTTDVAIDRVEITAITISAFKYDDGTRYWEDNDASGDAFTITITAEWNFTGNPYQGEVNVGYVGDNETYGPTSSLIRNDVEENPIVGAVQTRDNITVGSAIFGANNVYGTEVKIASSLPKIGWDNAAPSIDHAPSATNESSPWLYYDGSSNFGYFSDNMGGTLTPFNVGGTASDSIGVGLASISHDNPSFGDNPGNGESNNSWSFQFDIDSSDSALGATITITFIASDLVGNTNSTTFQFRRDNTNPTQNTLNLLLTADTDTVGNGIDPDTGYYDDDSVDVTIAGAPSDSGGSGLPSLRYSFRPDDGSYETWESGGITLTSVTEGSRTIYVLVRDNCGNNATDIDSVGVVVDLTDPVGYTKGTFSPTTVNALTYLYSSGTIVYFNGAYDDLGFDIGINDGTEINFWKVRQPEAFGEPEEELTISPYRRTTDYNINSTDVGRTIDILVIDHAGRNQTITITVIEDSDGPELSGLNLDYTPDTDSVGNGISPVSGFYDDDSVDVTISNSPTDSGSGLPTTRYSFKYDGGSYGSWLSGGTTLTSVPEGIRNITVQVRDNVQNTAELDFVLVTVDLTNPSGYTSTIFETNNEQYLYNETGLLIYFNGAFDNLRFDVNITSGTETNFWKVRFPAAFGESEEEDLSAPYERIADYEINSTDTGTAFDILVIDSAGRTQTITITVTEDSTAPLLGTLNLLLTGDTDSVGNGITPDTGY
ncbi:MAG: hypothetical protein ACW99Q_26075, partial [Candidatus Kariarchaeaceae archaeon]